MALPQGTIGHLYCEIAGKDFELAEKYAREQAERMGADPLDVCGKLRGNNLHMTVDYDASGFPDYGEWLIDPDGQRYSITSRLYLRGKINVGILSTNQVSGQREVRDGLVMPGLNTETFTGLSRKLANGWRVEK